MNHTKPMIIEGSKAYFNVVHIRLNPERTTAQSLKIMEQLFKKYNPEYPFEYHFVDEEYARKFDDTQRIATLTGLFAGLTIFISCLGFVWACGLHGREQDKRNRSKKSIGRIRIKHHGITVKGISFTGSNIHSHCIAHCMVCHAHMAQGYSYRINIQWWVFADGGYAGSNCIINNGKFPGNKSSGCKPGKKP